MKLRMIAIVLMLPIMINLLVFSSTDIVVEAQTIRVASVEVDQETMEFDRLHTTRRLTAIVLPFHANDRSVTFTSTDESVAIVDQFGDIKAISNGTTFITVTTSDGGHQAVSTVIVQSYFIEKFNVEIGERPTGDLDYEWDQHSASILEEDYEYITVVVSPVESMVQNVPFYSLSNPNIVRISQFEIYEQESSTVTFRARLTAIRRGNTSVRIFINELPTGDTLERHLEVNVEPRTDTSMRFVFDYLRFDQNTPLVTASSIIPLQISMVHLAEQTQFSLYGFPSNEEYNGEIDLETTSRTSVAFIDKEENVLRFTQAGTVTLYFYAGTDSDHRGYVSITSTYHRINQDDLRDALSEFDNLKLFYRQSFQIRFDVNPFDFIEFYNVNWTHSDGLSLMIGSFNNVFVQATQVMPDQWVRVEFVPIDTSFPEIYFYFDVTVSNFGVNDITFELNNDEAFIRGLERTYVFGNKNIIGEDYQLALRFFTQSPPGALSSFIFTSNNTDIATVDNTGLVVFNSDFNDFNEFGRAYVIVSARSVYPTLANPNIYAEDAYTFVVVRGSNVYDTSDYVVANDNGLDIVLRNNISFLTPITTLGSLHGNGYMMDASAIANDMNAPTDSMFIFHNNDNMLGNNETLISNVVFSGFSDADINALRNRGTLVTLHANTTLQYSILERAAILLYISVEGVSSEGPLTNENIHVYSSLFSYAGLAGAYLGSSRNRGLTASNIVFEDIIFERSLIGIVFEPSDMRDVQPNNRDAFELTLKGTILFYNWLRVEDLMRLSLTFEGQNIDLSMFDFELETFEKDEYEYVQLSIVIIDLMDEDQTSYWWMTSAVFSDVNNTASRLGTIATRTNETPIDGTDFTVGNAVSRRFISIPAFITGTETLYIGRPVLSIYNPRTTSRYFVCPEDQVNHLLNPDFSLITRQIQ